MTVMFQAVNVRTRYFNSERLIRKRRKVSTRLALQPVTVHLHKRESSTKITRESFNQPSCAHVSTHQKHPLLQVTLYLVLCQK
jgi:tRNA G18 (ribose-2'-O)-methylase SpoU